MGTPRGSRWGLWTLAAVLAVTGGLLALQGFIHLEANSTADRAAARFGGDRVAGLISLADCSRCGLRERDRAVWALGELHDQRALPVLKAYYTGGACDHAAGLCQYELSKAIRKIENARELGFALTFRPGAP